MVEKFSVLDLSTHCVGCSLPILFAAIYLSAFNLTEPDKFLQNISLATNALHILVAVSQRVHLELDISQNYLWCSNSWGPEIFVRSKVSKVISHGWAGGQANLWFTECTNFPPTCSHGGGGLPKYPYFQASLKSSKTRGELHKNSSRISDIQKAAQSTE